MQTILIAAGGTGGHIFPALAIAKQLTKTHKIIWLGSQHGMENSLVKNYPLINVDAVGVRGKSIKKLIVAPLQILRAIWQTRKIIKQHQVRLVLCMGGFVGGVGGLATIFSATKLVLHEQNSIAGTSNKWLNLISNKTFQAFDNTLKGATTCGNPINFTGKVNKPTSYPLHILVLGGSLGAKRINDVIPQLNVDATIIHQVGKKNITDIKNNNISGDYHIVDFINDMASAYADADLVIARSGAMTISELIYTQTPAILIPFPFAIDNHQLHNAKILEDNGCGIIIEEKELTVKKLENVLQTLTLEKLQNMQQNFAKIPQHNAAQVITDHITTLLY
jgi:UDP-N-acetylglucosamine--N-acetylmuramyl-(pentapeptide) pyrophosphoryl-undecaprenol N-acetylglucosamine transferase